MDTRRRLDLPVGLERSRSGGGAHVWLFFDGAVPAVLARRLGAYLLTETMERRPDLGFDSYDRLFPNQDTLPQGGFGNLIALPLQKAARGSAVCWERSASRSGFETNDSPGDRSRSASAGRCAPTSRAPPHTC